MHIPIKIGILGLLKFNSTFFSLPEFRSPTSCFVFISFKSTAYLQFREQPIGSLPDLWNPVLVCVTYSYLGMPTLSTDVEIFASGMPIFGYFEIRYISPKSVLSSSAFPSKSVVLKGLTTLSRTVSW